MKEEVLFGAPLWVEDLFDGAEHLDQALNKVISACITFGFQRDGIIHQRKSPTALRIAETPLVARLWLDIWATRAKLNLDLLDYLVFK